MTYKLDREEIINKWISDESKPEDKRKKAVILWHDLQMRFLFKDIKKESNPLVLPMYWGRAIRIISETKCKIQAICTPSTEKLSLNKEHKTLKSTKSSLTKSSKT